MIRDGLELAITRAMQGEIDARDESDRAFKAWCLTPLDSPEATAARVAWDQAGAAVRTAMVYTDSLEEARRRRNLAALRREDELGEALLEIREREAVEAVLDLPHHGKREGPKRRGGPRTRRQDPIEEGLQELEEERAGSAHGLERGAVGRPFVRRVVVIAGRR